MLYGRLVQDKSRKDSLVLPPTVCIVAIGELTQYKGVYDSRQLIPIGGSSKVLRGNLALVDLARR